MTKFKIGDEVNMIPITQEIYEEYKTIERGQGGFGYESYKELDKYFRVLTIKEIRHGQTENPYYLFEEYERGIYHYALDYYKSTVIIDLNKIDNLIDSFDEITR